MLRVAEAQWSIRVWRLALRPRDVVGSLSGLIPDYVLDSHGAWVNLFWRVYWLRERCGG